MKIGIGITTCGRRDLFEKCYDHIRKFLPQNAVISIADDTLTRYGVGYSKNRNIKELLAAGCTDIFLFDDDCYPIAHGWEKKYIESNEAHLSHIWHFSGKPYKDGMLTHSWECGCFLYYHRSCFEKCGYFPVYTRGMGEHTHMALKIFNFGLNSAPFLSFPFTDKFIFSHDEKSPVSSSIERTNRNGYCRYWLREERQPNRHKLPYSDRPKDLIITCTLSRDLDPQRGTYLSINNSYVSELRRSIKFGELIILSDTDKISGSIPVGNSITNNPYINRWHYILEYILSNNVGGRVWLVDASDVTQLNHDPFHFMKEWTIYCGTEQSTLSSPWMQNPGTQGVFPALFAEKNRHRQILNCGVVGGYTGIIIPFLKDLISELQKNKSIFDMGVFNALLYNGKYAYVTKDITTKFKAYESNNKIAYWKHK